MHTVEPKVYLVAETALVREGLASYLEHIGAEDWETNAPSQGEALVEVMGRLCYRSFKPGLNANVTKVRESSADYLTVSEFR